MTPAWLAQLAPYHAPPPAGWWPLAPGWWVLMLLLLVAIAGGLFWWRRRPARLRRAALRELKQLETHASDDAALARGLQQLVRRFAVARFGRETVASLSGERWIAFVVAHGGSDWAGATGASLLRSAYGGASPAERARWIAGARAFLKARK
jgi:hypothetical protein